MHSPIKKQMDEANLKVRVIFGAALLSSALLLTAGCAMNSTALSSSDIAEPTTAVMSGAVHGGQSPIYNATVSLYAAGQTGYGSSTTALATVTTDQGGGFQFNPASYTCPSPSTQMYLTSVGGNTQGTGNIATNNTAAALMVAIGPCSGIAGSYVQINEITSIATIFSLAQYINPGTTPGTESIGTAATLQAILGLANAVASMQNLASLTTGAPVGPVTYTGSNPTVSNVTVTATAETAKLVTLANVIAACINQTSASTTVCTNLLSAATPPAAAVTSQPGITFPAATDTIQAAYYMAVNPIDAGTVATCSPAASSNLQCIFNLTASSPPFQTGLTVAPTDWTIGVTYTATGACAGGGNFIAAPFHAAIDSVGNIWYVDGVNTGANLAEMSPTGTPLFCAGNTTYGRGITIDPTGNVWGAFESATLGIEEYNAAASSLITWPTPGGVVPYSIASDKSGNIFYSLPSTGTINKYAAPGASTTTFASSQVGVADTGSNLVYIAADQGGRIWAPDSSAGYLVEYYLPTGDSTPLTKVAITSNVLTVAVSPNPFIVGDQVTFSNLVTNTYLNGQTVTVTSITSTTFKAAFTHANVTSNFDTGTITLNPAGGYNTSVTTITGHGYGVAVDSNNYIYTVTTCCSGMQLEKFTPNSYFDNPTYAASAASLGGINGTRGLALDGAANVWIGAQLPQTTGGVYGVAEIATSGSGTSATFTALSPTGTTPTSCTTTACPTNGGFQKASFNQATDIEIDPSGNVWVMNTQSSTPDNGTSITEIVGAAVPTATPLSVAALNGALATKP